MKQTFKYWIYAKLTGSRMEYELSDINWTGTDMLKNRVLVSAHTVTLELPDIAESLPAMVAQLETTKQEMQATAAAAIAEVDAKIQSLLAIGQEVTA